MSKQRNQKPAPVAPVTAPTPDAATPTPETAPAPKPPVTGRDVGQWQGVQRAHWSAPHALPTAMLRLTGKPYRTGAEHNKLWWDAVQGACKEGQGTTTAMQAAGAPGHFINYAVRRGYLAKV